MAAKVLAFRHIPFEHLGMIADALDSHRLECQYVDLWQGNRRPISGARPV